MMLWEEIGKHDYADTLAACLTPLNKAECIAAQEVRAKVVSLMHFYVLHGSPPQQGFIPDMKQACLASWGILGVVVSLFSSTDVSHKSCNGPLKMRALACLSPLPIA